MSRKKGPAEQRRARGVANGYKRGAHQEEDSLRDENKHTSVTVKLHNEGLVLCREDVRRAPSWQRADTLF